MCLVGDYVTGYQNRQYDNQKIFFFQKKGVEEKSSRLTCHPSKHIACAEPRPFTFVGLPPVAHYPNGTTKIRIKSDIIDREIPIFEDMEPYLD